MFAGRAMFGPRGRRDAGSMPIAMLITLVGLTLSAGLTTMVVGQLKDSRWSADRTAAIAASQAGLDAGLAKIRAAVTGTAGDVTKLPCATVTASLTAIAGTSSAAAPTYKVSFGYFLADPSDKINVIAPIGDLANNSDASPNTLRAVRCVNGALPQTLPYSNTEQEKTLYVLLRSEGVVGGTTRTLYATYKVRTTWVTRQVINGATGRCLDGGDVGGLGSALTLAACQNGSGILANQRWTGPTIPSGAYMATGLIYTTSAADTGAPAPFCLISPGQNPGDVKVLRCKNNDNKQSWTAYGATVPALPGVYPYQITDGYGNCLQAAAPQGTPNPADPASWISVVTATCNGSASQQWNVPTSAIKGIQER